MSDIVKPAGNAFLKTLDRNPPVTFWLFVSKAKKNEGIPTNNALTNVK